MPPSVRQIGELAFRNCYDLRIIHISSIDNVFIYNEGWRTINKNIIVIVDNILNKNGLEPILSLEDIHICLESMPDHLPTSAQMQVMDSSFENEFPEPAEAARIHGINLLHILAHYPSGAGRNLFVSNLMFLLIQKCPEAIKSVDKDGHSPLYHLFAFNLRRDPTVVQRLLDYCDHRVLHQAILSKSADQDVIQKIAMAKVDLLLGVDAESGLVAFMLAAMGEKEHNLTLTYEMLRMKPDILLDYYNN